MKNTTLAILLGAALMADAPSALAQKPQASAVQEERPRLFVLTDIENEPDDAQSLIRLLLYANQIDIEGIVATNSVHMKDTVHPESVRALIKEYGKVQPNLLKHEKGFPSAERLLAKVSQGLPVYGMAGVGDGKNSPGSDLLVRAIQSNDPRPLWVSAWGGTNVLAQALLQLKQATSPAQFDKAISRVRVYAISDQDDSGAWIRKNFPSLFYIVSPGTYVNATWTAINSVIEGIDNTTVSNAWLASNIQQGHGPLGAAYPDVGFGMEGDTPSFLGIIPNGLNVPDRPDWGGWGGRYALRTPPLGDSNIPMINGGIPVVPETRPIWAEVSDTIIPALPMPYNRFQLYGKAQPKPLSGPMVTLWRWRDDFQNDFAARMRWTIRSYAQANHPPKPALAHSDRLTVQAGAAVKLDARGSTDPDGDSLSYQWIHYMEAGSLQKPIPFFADNLLHTTFVAPDVDKPETTHFILRVTDKGTPALTRYKRVIVTILPKK